MPVLSVAGVVSFLRGNVVVMTKLHGFCHRYSYAAVTVYALVKIPS